MTQPHNARFASGQIGYQQVPVAVVGMACRLPGDNNSPHALWEFIQGGGIASNKPPANRFNIAGHYDGSNKAGTMRPPGGMFLENVDPKKFDASFFGIGKTEAISMDPQQRQLLEVVYEGLENSGISLDSLSGSPFGCFVGSFAVDYGDIQGRNPEDRPALITVGTGRAILANRISHFLNINGPSMTLDTACSGSLIGVDVACRYLNSGEINGAIVAGSNLYLSPEHVMDTGIMKNAHSLTGRCHTFDAKADGYIKAEAINAVVLKRLDDAINDRDPIHAVIRGSATNSDGRTPGIANPSSEAQAAAVINAYKNAGIQDLSETAHVECHGTGTQAGDPTEITGVHSVFGSSRSTADPIIVGSIKSNIGHAEPAAGLSGLLKAVMAVETGIIPGNPTFIEPTPKIDFKAMKIRPTRTALPWPSSREAVRRASVNSFGYGGSNCHVVVDNVEPYLQHSAHVSSYLSDDDFMLDGEITSSRPATLVLSANDESSLRSYYEKLTSHLSNLNVSVQLGDLAYTLSERRSHLFHRAYIVSRTTDLDHAVLQTSKKRTKPPRIGFVFTGQGAQWSQMGKAFTTNFPRAYGVLRRLDHALQQLPEPPSWSLLEELVEPRKADHLRKPEFSQPLVTALQLAIVDTLESCGVLAGDVVGHSSGEIAAAATAGFLSYEEAIAVAYYRGQAAKHATQDAPLMVGMMAVGLGPDAVTPYIHEEKGKVEIACINSPSSVTLSGVKASLESVRVRLVADSHFARLLQVDLAYHSRFMDVIGEDYGKLLKTLPSSRETTRLASWWSSVDGELKTSPADVSYWQKNMVSPVLFSRAFEVMMDGADPPDFVIEIGPTGALAGPIAQIKKTIDGVDFEYATAMTRGEDAETAMFDLAGKLFLAGAPIDLAGINNVTTNESAESETTSSLASVIVDLPNYSWNHSVDYWHESEASKDWRFRKFPVHDILGTKVLGASWTRPSFKRVMSLEEVTWLKDHKMGSDILFPAAGYIAMAVEAMYQMSQQPQDQMLPIYELGFRLRNIKFKRALVMDENTPSSVMTTLTPLPGPDATWYVFTVASTAEGTTTEHCTGLVKNDLTPSTTVAHTTSIQPLEHSTPGALWYKTWIDIGYSFGPSFKRVEAVEACPGHRDCRAIVNFEEPPTATPVQSTYSIHPACIDGCFHTTLPALWNGTRSSANAVLVPASIDTMYIGPRPRTTVRGISTASAAYSGRGRLEQAKNFTSNCSVYDPDNGALLLEVDGFRCDQLDVGIDLLAKHTYMKTVWKPDIVHIDQADVSNMSAENEEAVATILDLFAYKWPSIRVLEAFVAKAESSSRWLATSSTFDTRPYEQCTIASSDAKSVVQAQGEYSGYNGVSFELADLGADELSLANAEFDLIIVQTAHLSHAREDIILSNARRLLSKRGSILILEETTAVVNGNWPAKKALDELNVIDIPTEAFSSARLIKPSQPSKDKHLHLAQFRKRGDTEASVVEVLKQAEWLVTEASAPFMGLEKRDTVLVLDEVQAPLLADVSAAEWNDIKQLLFSGAHVVWVTIGSQYEVTEPHRALIHGLFRTVRSEDPNLALTTLDVGPADISSVTQTVQRILGSLRRQDTGHMSEETELTERHGVVHIARLLPDKDLNHARSEAVSGAATQMQSLFDLKPVAMLRAERLGSLDALQYSAMTHQELPVKPGHIEIDIRAAALNFKDVAVSMGIVPENEHLLGLEGAGIVRRVGPGVTAYQPGDRVAVLEKGTFANKVQTPVERAHLIPDGMSFENAATIPLVFLTSMYALIDIGGLRKDQTVLIHSATGGVGLSSIQLARWVGAEVFATAGTDSKRDFLVHECGLPRDHIFSSRDTDFARGVMAVTCGRGVDVIINSLTGELLDETWRICADGGTMVEIGKRDIVAKSYLSMEPFDRNCSFRAVDFSYTKDITDDLISRLLQRTFSLVEQGHLTPIHPITTFSFDNIPGALAYMRAGRHMGKIIVTDPDPAVVQVPIRPPPRRVQLDESRVYIIIGGLKGLCGSLALCLALHGAKSIAVMSRSGVDDSRSQGVVRACQALGCKVEGHAADVSDDMQVRKVFSGMRLPIGGIIQGAMVLRDKPYEMMTVDEFHATISSKVQGTWNLHEAAVTANAPLEFFTLLSSVSGVLGQKGQANYAAANVFMDNFAAFRRAMGLPANSVNLGVVEDVGYVAEQGGSMQSRFDARVWTGIPEAVLHDILQCSILQQGPNAPSQASGSQLCTGIAMPQPLDSPLAGKLRFAHLFTGGGAGGATAASGAAGEDQQELQAFFVLHKSGASRPGLLAAALDLVSKRFQRMLRLEEPLEAARPLSAYGVDSLSAVEFRNWVRSDLQADITTLEVTSAASVSTLCERILGKMSVA